MRRFLGHGSTAGSKAILSRGRRHSAQRFLPTILQTHVMARKVAVSKSRD
jgi:hypothetical protein